jgi:alpha-beta hydrolase superfamily lysophospholipase
MLNIMFVGVLLVLALATAIAVGYGVNQLTQPERNLAGGIPSDYGLPYETISFPSYDGTMLHGWFVPAIEPRATVVFCHGRAGSKAPDLIYVPQFRQHGFNVLLFDFRAHGESDGRTSSLVYYERRDLLAAIAYLRQRGIEEVGLMGFSMGAAVATAAAPLSRAVRAVVADSAFAELRTILVSYLRQQGVPNRIASGLAALIIWVAGLRLRCHLPDADPLHWVGRIAPRPLLLIHGGQDQGIPVSDASRLYEAAGEPKELWIVPEARHRCVDKVSPEEYMSKVLSFFDRWLAAEDKSPPTGKPADRPDTACSRWHLRSTGSARPMQVRAMRGHTAAQCCRSAGPAGQDVLLHDANRHHVPVIRSAPVAAGTASVPLRPMVGATAHHFGVAVCRPARVLPRRLLIVAVSVPVGNPFRPVPTHVVQA